MEDLNMLTADCCVLSCCCQCLILQILLFIFVEIPYKLIKMMKDYVGKKFAQRNKGEEEKGIEGGYERGIQIEGFPITSDCHSFDGCCLEEVERVLWGFSQKGEFAFGSFWGREEGSTCVVAKQGLDNDVIHYHLIEIVGSFSC